MMITTLMNKKRGLSRLSKQPGDGDPWAPNNLLKPGTKENYILTSSCARSRQYIHAHLNCTFVEVPNLIWKISLTIP